MHNNNGVGSAAWLRGLAEEDQRCEKTFGVRIPLVIRKFPIPRVQFLEEILDLNI